MEYSSGCYGNMGCAAERIGNLYGSHLRLFGNYGLYDIKREMQIEIGNAIVLCGSDGCGWVDYSAPGNIMYGYLSAARGVPQWTSWLAGGGLETKDLWAQEGFDSALENIQANGSSWWDNPGDKAAVDFGYDLYDKYPDGMTVTNFKNELSVDVLDTFQSPPMLPETPPREQRNVYPPGKFLN
jgi:hypothetical protein